MEKITVRISDIIVRKEWNIRRQVIQADLNSLKNSILMNGLLHPIVVNASMQLVSGHRRLEAFKALGYTEIPAVIKDFETEMHERLAHIDENIEAKNLNEKDFEKALAERKRIYELLNPQSTKPGPKGEEVKSFSKDTAEKTGLAEPKIRRLTRRVDDVTEEVRQAYENNQITSSQIDEMVKIPIEDQNRILQKIIGVSVAETKLIVDDFVKSKKQERPKKPKKQKKKKNDDVDVDDPESRRILEAITTVEKLGRSISETGVLIDEMIILNKTVKLKQEYYTGINQKLDELKEQINILQEQIG